MTNTDGVDNINCKYDKFTITDSDFPHLSKSFKVINLSKNKKINNL